MTPNHDPVPHWTDDGVMPASRPDDPTSRNRSPYAVSLVDLVTQLGFTRERRDLLSGLLNFRAELHEVGLIRGFQWVNGSFVEHVEETDDRPPNDIDVVTFFHLPVGESIESLWLARQDLFTPQVVKARYHADAYFAPFNPRAPEDIVKQTTYWYSLWSHNRNGLWKGFLQIDLANLEDAEARQILTQIDDNGGEP